MMLRGGKLVALPTETVYGLAADIGKDAAVRRIFQVKGRPMTNPLIVHVADIKAAKRCVAHWPAEAQALAERFWPGPLTLVLPRSALISDLITAGGPTVAVRVPDHPLTLEVLRQLYALGATGVAAPSANRSEHVSPTTAHHVRDDLGDAVDLILDGGPCRVGIESTVVRIGDGAPTVLRPGGVSRDQLREAIGHVELTEREDRVTQSPGRHARHYAPAVPTRVVEGDQLDRVGPIVEGKGLAIVAVRGMSNLPAGASVHEMPADPAAYAAGLYAAMRELEKRVERIVLVLPPDRPEWSAVRDRLRRAGDRGPDG